MLKLFKKSYTEEETRIFEFLRRARLFEKLVEDELIHFLPYMYLRTYKQQEVVFFSGDPSNALYVIKSGIVSLNVDLNGEFEKLMTLRKGKVFGDNSILPASKRIYSSIVMSDRAELYVIPKANLTEVMMGHPLIRAKIMTAFAEIHNEYMMNLFKTYRSARGFFDLTSVYSGFNV